MIQNIILKKETTKKYKMGAVQKFKFLLKYYTTLK